MGSALTCPSISYVLPPKTGTHRATVWQSLDLKLVPPRLFPGFIPHALDSYYRGRDAWVPGSGPGAQASQHLAFQMAAQSLRGRLRPCESPLSLRWARVDSGRTCRVGRRAPGRGSDRLRRESRGRRAARVGGVRVHPWAGSTGGGGRQQLPSPVASVPEWSGDKLEPLWSASGSSASG